MKKYIIALSAIVLILSSCNKKGNFNIDGTITNASDSTLYLETAVNGVWFLVDSIKTNDKGDFKLKRESPDFPEIYRLSLGNQSIYVPVDSIETINIKSNAKSFGTDYTLSGSPKAVQMMNVDKKVREIYLSGNNDANAKANFKREIGNEILKDPSSIVAYYIINKQVGNVPLYNPEDKADLGIICAVATAYKSFKPSDPRSELLEKIALTAQRKYRARVATSSKADTIYANVSQIIEISLPDKNGNMQDFSKITSKGNVVILNFTAYTLENSPAINQKLAEVYSKYKSRGLEIYQIGIDPDLTKWKLAATNLPWIAVYDESGANSRNLINYNVGAIPMTFVIDRHGAIQQRIIDLNELDSAVAKYL